MPEPVNPPASPSDTPPPSSTPPGSTGGAPWRAPATAGKFAGKTAEELLGIAQGLAEIVAEPRPAATPAPTSAPDAFDIGDDDFVSGKDLKAALARTKTVDTASAELFASTNESLIRTEQAAMFAKYGPEIDATIKQLPPAARTLDNLRRVVRFVQSDHLDEIVAERSQRLAAEMAPTLRSTGNGAPPAGTPREYSLESEKIDPEWKKRALANGITEETVAEFCRSNDMSPVDFYKQFDTPLNRIVEDVSTKRRSA